MRALTLTQPWAGLVASGIKRIENRPRNAVPAEVRAGEPFAIHASRELDRAAMRRVIEIEPRLALDHPDSLARQDRLFELMTTTSCVIGTAVHCGVVTDPVIDDPWWGDLTDEDWRWFFGPFGHVLRDQIALREPIACKGALGFWTLPADVERQVVEQLGGSL